MADLHNDAADLMLALTRLADETIEEETGKKYGIIFVVFDPEEPNRSNYTSNINRRDAALSLIELGKRLLQDRKPGGM